MQFSNISTGQQYAKTCRCKERNSCLSSDLLLSRHSQPTTYYKLASLPGRAIATQQPQFAPSDCLRSSHTLTLQPQQRPYPNRTNFPFLPSNPPQKCSARRQEITHIVQCVDSGFPKAGSGWISCLLGWTWYETTAYSQMSIRFEEMIAVNAEKKGIFLKKKKEKKDIPLQGKDNH